MASPQIENGYTPIASEIIDAICKTKLNGTQNRLIMAVWRGTYGFNKKNHSFSLSYLSNYINSPVRVVSRELKNLENMGILIINENKGKPRTMQFNKNYDTWL